LNYGFIYVYKKEYQDFISTDYIVE